MAEPLRILILEDNPADAALVQFELQDAGIVFIAKVVMTEQEFIRELQEYCPDIILSDYDLPKYTGALALAEAKRRCPDTPFILVTGAVTEDRAIDILTQGAKDYVLKKLLDKRLVPAVKRALAEAEELKARKKAEEELREAHRTLETKVKARTAELEAEMAARKEMEDALHESETNYRELVENANSIIIKMDQNGILTFVNDFTQKFFGYTWEELIGKNVKILLPPFESTGRNLKALADTVLRNPNGHTENINENIRKNGERVWISWRNKGIMDSHGNIIGNLAIGQDITNLKRTEETLRESESQERARAIELQAIIDAVPGIVFIAHDPECKKMTGSRATDEFLRLQPEANLSKSAPDSERPVTFRAMKNGEEIAPDELPVQQAASGRAIRDCELDILFSDGVKRTIFGNASPVFDEHGNPRGAIGVFRDITMRKQTEEALRARVEELQRLLDIVPAAVWIAGDPQCLTITGNRLADNFYEATSGENVSATTLPDVRRFFDQNGRELAASDLPMQVAVDTNQDVRDVELHVHLPSGRQIVMLGNAIPLRDEISNVRGCIASFIDITDRKRAEEAMLQSQNQFNLLIKNIRSGVALIDDTGKFTVVNPSFLRMFGLKDDETINNVNDKNWNNWQVFESDGTLLHVDEHPVRKAALTGKPVKDKLVGVRLPSGGDLVWMLISADLVRRTDGSIQSTICTYYDITERKRVDEALKESERSLAEAQRVAHIGSWEWDLRSGDVHWSAELYSIYGLASNTYVPNIRTFAEFVHPDDRDRIGKLIQQVVSTGTPVNFEFRIIRADGLLRVLSARGEITAWDEDGKPRLMVGINQDVTDRRQAEDALKERTQQLEEANKELESFSYSVSHDLKAPLRAIEGYSRMLLKKDADKLSEDTICKLDVIRINTKKMNTLIDDLLSFSKVLKSDIAVSEINMDGLVKEVWAEVKAANAERKLELKTTDILPGKGDQALIRQVLVNLLSNAVKFTKTRKKGIIEVCSYNDNGNAVYTIKDNGIGFNMAFYDKLFGVFQRLHGVQEYEGTGIGLAIVHRIINRHGGKVWAEGEVDKGATFFFTLPTQQE